MIRNYRKSQNIISTNMLSIGDAHLGNCIQLMPDIEPCSVDMVLCDLPYGVTRNEWDRQLPFKELWDCYKKVCKESAAIVLFADGMFMADLMNSNKSWWKYNMIWDKAMPSGFPNANRMPLRTHEEICVFYKKQCTYNPQKWQGKPSHGQGRPKTPTSNNYGKRNFQDNSKELGDMKHPTSIIRFSKTHPSKMKHPTEKPVPLLEWLIKTYTNEGDLVLDNCCGCGSTLIAAKNLGRLFIGIEKNPEYFKMALDRIKNPEEIT